MQKICLENYGSFEQFLMEGSVALFSKNYPFGGFNNKNCCIQGVFEASGLAVVLTVKSSVSKPLKNFTKDELELIIGHVNTAEETIDYIYSVTGEVVSADDVITLARLEPFRVDGVPVIDTKISGVPIADLWRDS